MSNNGVRKRIKVRWMTEVDGGAVKHAFPQMSGGVMRDYTLCGIKLRSMHLWRKPGNEGQCPICKLTMGKGSRA